MILRRGPERYESDDAALTDVVRGAARPIVPFPRSYDPLLEMIGDARFVLLGEASHGTHEFYRERAVITRRLIEERGVTAVAVEADWPDAYRVNRYVLGQSDDTDAREALSGFHRFPSWMWRNADVAEFVEWLRAYNESLPRTEPMAGFYGLDLYSLRASLQAVVQTLDRMDPEAARRARDRYACFDRFAWDERVYGLATGPRMEKSCEAAVVEQLLEMNRRTADQARHGGLREGDELFYAEQNARVAKNAERFYRSMFLEETSTWNLRDHHMAETLQALVAHRERRGERAKVVVWAHNAHLGDARATETGRKREINMGQLVRQKHGLDAVLVGFTTDHGTVTAASDWGGPTERKVVRPAVPGSYEAIFHEALLGRFLLLLRGKHLEPLRKERLERAIGVIYRPHDERASHYFLADLPGQFDAVLHFDDTRAVEPLERSEEWIAGGVPETYPFGV